MKKIKIFKTNTLDGIWHKVNGQKYLDYVGVEDLTEISLKENNEHYGDYLSRLNEAILEGLGIKKWKAIKETDHTIIWEISHEDGSVYYVVELKYSVEYTSDTHIPADADEGYFKRAIVDFTGVALRLLPTDYVGGNEWEGLFPLSMNRQIWQVGCIRYLGNDKFMFRGFKETGAVRDANIQ